MSEIEREDVTNKGNPFLSTKYTVSYLLLFSTSCEESKHQYLHEMGWAEDEHGLHTQNWVQAAMNTFHSKQAKWEHQLCSTCHELWPTQVCARAKDSSFECTRCKRDKKNPKLYSADNDMHPGPVPPCLQDLTQVEEMLIARACPIMCVFHKHGGQRAYKGHVVNLPQNIQGFLDTLPANVNDLPILIVRRQGSHDTC